MGCGSVVRPLFIDLLKPDAEFGPGLGSFLSSLTHEVISNPGLAVVVVQFIISMVALLAVLILGCPALFFVVMGTTMIEWQFPMKEYVQIKPEVYCPLGKGFYEQQWYQNVKDILGRRWWLRLLLPTRGGPLDMGPGVAPKPSKAGREALQQRIAQVEKEGVSQEVTSCRDLGINPGPENA